MGKILIANALDIYRDNGKLTIQEAQARQSYHLRYLWRMEARDILVVPEMPDRDYLMYFAGVQCMNSDNISIVTFEHLFSSASSVVYADREFRRRLSDKMSPGKNWHIQSCYLNRAMLDLADHLNIPVHPDMRAWAHQDGFRRANSKAFFRRAAKLHQIPIAEGTVCHTPAELAAGMQNLFDQTGLLILKQEHNGGGRGNIGVSLNFTARFQGVSESLVIHDKHSIPFVADKLWKQTATRGQKIILEVYYPNTGTFTIQICVPEAAKTPDILYEAEIRMDSTWLGVQIPAAALSADEKGILCRHAMTLAKLLQKKGYQGYLCCDAIRLRNGTILFTEINVRPGAESSAHYFAVRHLGHDYARRHTIMTRRDVKISSFDEIHRQLQHQDLLYRKGKNQGAAILFADSKHGRTMELLLAAPNPQAAAALEAKVLASLR